MLPIHDCVQTSLENEYFRQKLTEFYKENKRLKEEINLLKNIPTRDLDETPRSEISTQTVRVEFASDVPRGSTTCSVCCDRVNTTQKTSTTRVLKNSKENSGIKTKEKFDSDFFNQQNKKSYVKLCEMQHSLLKKYEDEVNSNAVKQDLINHMKIELDQLTEAVKAKEAENASLSKRLDQLDELEAKLKTLLLDYEACKKKCRNYKAELKCFDEKFFEELEDLKYNFYESIKLNKHYERLLFKLNKEDLIVSAEDENIKRKKKKKNRVKFVDKCERSFKKTANDVRLSELKQSFESMNKNYKESLASVECGDEDSEHTAGESEVETGLGENFKSFDFEDYLGGSDNENSTLDYKELIRKLTS